RYPRRYQHSARSQETFLRVMLSSGKKFDDLSQTAGICRTTAGLPNCPASYLPRSVSLMPPTTLRTLPAALPLCPRSLAWHRPSACPQPLSLYLWFAGLSPLSDPCPCRCSFTQGISFN